MGQGAEGIGHGIERDRRAEQRHQSAGVEIALFYKRAEQSLILPGSFLVYY
jgi:hypothetical protein